LNKSMTMFGLIDPGTNQPFPGPISLNAVPFRPDPATEIAYKSWQQATTSAYSQYCGLIAQGRVDEARRRQQNIQMAAVAANLVLGGVKLASQQ
jgi:hypothetical protein